MSTTLLAPSVVPQTKAPRVRRLEHLYPLFGFRRRVYVAPPGFANSETPRFAGRGIAAIAADPKRHRWNQCSVTAGELAREYGFTDLDGRQPDAWLQM